MFINDNGTGPFAPLLFPVVGADLYTGDELLLQANNGMLYMDEATYQRFFDGVPALPRIIGKEYFEPGHVPLSPVLRAIAYLRGDASSAPPDTGSAGLASGRW